jgi:hypothetical protein
MNKKKGQMQISFGVIFSIILIVIFIAFAIYAISKFMEIKTTAQLAKFKGNLQDDVDTAWKSTHSSQEVKYFLPNKVKQVCFIDDENENFYFIPDDFKGGMLKNINIASTIASSTDRPRKLCINTTEGKVLMTIKKAYNEDLVTITK